MFFIQRRIYINDVPYTLNNGYPYTSNNGEGIHQIMEDNNIITNNINTHTQQKKIYNQKTGLALFCPITSHVKGYPFEVVLENHSINGCILSDQVKNLDYVQRKCSFIEKASKDEINSVIENIKLMIE